jgi:hypothetical protein
MLALVNEHGHWHGRIWEERPEVQSTVIGRAGFARTALLASSLHLVARPSPRRHDLLSSSSLKLWIDHGTSTAQI